MVLVLAPLGKEHVRVQIQQKKKNTNPQTQNSYGSTAKFQKWTKV